MGRVNIGKERYRHAMDAGSLLREARCRAGLSQAELARRAEVPQSVVSEYERGKRQPAVQTLSRLVAATGHQLTLGLERHDPTVRGVPNSPLGRRLRRHRKALLAAVEDAGGSNLRVFGSVARGEDGPDSDVDLLVDLPDDMSLFAVLKLEGTLESILNVKVDLASVTSLKPRVRAEALSEAVAL
jgi:predicted nucleotidyltransferase/DNA-binding XRE family transcriptional regulator